MVGKCVHTFCSSCSAPQKLFYIRRLLFSVPVISSMFFFSAQVAGYNKSSLRSRVSRCDVDKKCLFAMGVFMPKMGLNEGFMWRAWPSITFIFINDIQFFSKNDLLCISHPLFRPKWQLGQFNDIFLSVICRFNDMLDILFSLIKALYTEQHQP